MYSDNLVFPSNPSSHAPTKYEERPVDEPRSVDKPKRLSSHCNSANYNDQVQHKLLRQLRRIGPRLNADEADKSYFKAVFSSLNRLTVFLIAWRSQGLTASLKKSIKWMIFQSSSAFLKGIFQ